jgi:transcription elongation factor GreA
MKKIVRFPKTIRFTKDGYNKVKNKLKALLKNRPAAVATLARARAMGDLSENGFYKAAKGKLFSIDDEITKLDYQLKFGVIQKKNSGQIGVGSIVSIESDGKKTVFHIVGDFEADPKQKKISLNSPIGRALAGKKISDKAFVYTPSGQMEYKVIDIK